jgi:hypothetical protein
MSTSSFTGEGKPQVCAFRHSIYIQISSKQVCFRQYTCNTLYHDWVLHILHVYINNNILYQRSRTYLIFLSLELFL